MRVGYDLDGVGYIFGGSVRDWLHLNDIIVPDPTDEFCTSWNFYEFWGMTREEFAKHCDDGVDAGIVFGPGDHLTRPYFFNSIKTVKELGHEVIIVTHRYQGSPGRAEHNTYQWLEPVLPYVDEIHFSHDKTIVHTDTFVEDSLPNYDALNAAGVNAFLINRPWNAPYDDGRKRISDISDYTNLIVKYGDRLAPHKVTTGM